MPLMNQATISQSDKDQARKREQARRQGHKFIVVENNGPESYDRIHSIEDVEAYEQWNPEVGANEWVVRPLQRPLTFVMDDMTGARTAIVLDTVYNRFFLARQLASGLRIVDPVLAEEIQDLVNKPYRRELSTEEDLLAKKQEIEKKLAEIEAKKAKTTKAVEDAADNAKESAGTKPDGDAEPRRRGRPPKRGAEADAMNESATTTSQ